MTSEQVLARLMAGHDAAAIESFPATLPDVPVVILIAVPLPEKPESLTQTPDGAEAWDALHAALIEPLTNAAQVVTRRSGHHIQRVQPDLVLAARGELMQAVRDGRQLSAGPIRVAAQGQAQADGGEP